MKVDRKTAQEAIIHLSEKIDISNSSELKDLLQGLYDENYKMITVDFSKTGMIDSSCLGKLLMFQKKFKENGGGLIIINVTSDYIRKMFVQIHLHKVIDIIDR
jgi:anti-sigma B factor antagonist